MSLIFFLILPIGGCLECCVILWDVCYCIVLHCIVVYCIVLSCVAMYHTATSYKPIGSSTTTTTAAAATTTTTTTQFPHNAQGFASTITGQQQAFHLLLNSQLAHCNPQGGSHKRWGERKTCS